MDIKLKQDSSLKVLDHNGNRIVEVHDDGTIDGIQSSPMISITHAELKALRDSGQLVAGMNYRITDYECTTDQPQTRSAHHNFDIIVTADAPNRLSEHARACFHGDSVGLYSESMGLWFYRYPSADGDYNNERYFAFYNQEEDKYIYTKVLSGHFNEYNVYYFYKDEDSFIPVSDDQIYCDPMSADEQTIDDDTFYFANSKLEAWKLMYCLDNDTTRFAWAKNEAIRVKPVGENSYYVYIRYPIKDIDGKYAWAYTSNNDATNFNEVKNWLLDIDDTDIIYTDTLEPSVGDILEMQGEDVEVVAIREKGKGVIYRMIDEFNNDVPYDFKNILFRRLYEDDDDSALTIFDGVYIGVNYHATCIDNMYYPRGYVYVSLNDYREYYTFCWVDNEDDPYDYSLLGNASLRNDENQLAGCYNNKIEKYIHCDYPMVEIPRQWLNNNVFVDHYEVEGGLTYGFYNNVFGKNSYGNTFYDSASIKNNVIGERFQFNTIRGGFIGNVIGRECKANILSYAFANNKIDYNFRENEAGQGFDQNDIGRNNSRNVFNNDFQLNKLYDNVSYSRFANDCYNIIIENNNSLVLTSEDVDGIIGYIHVHPKATSNQYVLVVPRGLDYPTDYYKSGSTEYYL